MILLMSKDRGRPFNKKRLLQGERGGWNYQYPKIGERGGKALQDYNKQQKEGDIDNLQGWGGEGGSPLTKL